MPFWSIELLLRRDRIQKISPFFPSGGTLVDIGCDDPPLTIQHFGKDMDRCIGIDAEVNTVSTKHLTFIKHWIKKSIPVESESADVITMLAVLEHMDYPETIARECVRILKPGGTLLVTVPSPMVKPFLELFARLGIVRKEMIDQHKNYFTPCRLKKMFKTAGFKRVTVSQFQFGLNTFMKAVK